MGKCLYESAMGSTRRLNVKARFSRSFLAQLLGLRVSYRVRLHKFLNRQIFEQTSNPRRKSGLTHFTFKQVHSTWRLCRSFLLSGAANKLELF